MRPCRGAPLPGGGEAPFLRGGRPRRSPGDLAVGAARRRRGAEGPGKARERHVLRRRGPAPARGPGAITAHRGGGCHRDPPGRRRGASVKLAVSFTGTKQLTGAKRRLVDPHVFADICEPDPFGQALAYELEPIYGAATR